MFTMCLMPDNHLIECLMSDNSLTIACCSKGDVPMVTNQFPLGNQTYLEEDVHQCAGSTDPIPIIVYVTLAL